MVRHWQFSAIAGMVVLVCAALVVAGSAGPSAISSDETVSDEVVEVTYVTPEDTDEFVVVSDEEMAEWSNPQGSAVDAVPTQADLACAISIPGNYVAFQTIAQGKWSAFGWCGDPWDGAVCAEVYPPPPWLCQIPARPHFESVIRDECVWEDFWAAHSFFGTEPPEVNFDQYAVIAVVLGEREQCSYRVNISSIQLTDCGLKVNVTECVRMNSTPFTVNPYHFVKLPKACVPYCRNVCFSHGCLHAVTDR